VTLNYIFNELLKLRITTIIKKENYVECVELYYSKLELNLISFLLPGKGCQLSQRNTNLTKKIKA